MMGSCVEIMIDRVFAVVVTQFALAMTICGELRAATASEEFSEKCRSAAAGAFADSVAHWKKAEALFEETQNFFRTGRNGIAEAVYHSLKSPGWPRKPLCVHRILRCGKIKSISRRSRPGWERFTS